MHLSIGELLQMESSRNFSIDEDKYYETIKYKTASLISVCCEAGAYSAGASQNDIELCRQFGEKLGCIFQIKDDILDYVGNDKTGKQIGIDIKEKKVTLPLICAWYNIDEDHKRRVSGLWSSIDHNSENFKEIIEIVVENKGISECEKVMKKLKSNALEVLNKFNDSEAKLALAKLLDYIIEREK